MENLDYSRIINSLKKGKIVVYPTDTLYGIGADIFNDNSVKNVFKIKKRPFENPLSVAVNNIDKLEEIAFLNKTSRKLAETFFPGGLTLILNKKTIISDIITAGLKKVAVRIPDNKVALKLLSEFGPLTATSANIHGKKTPVIIKDIIMQFNKGEIDSYLDVGKVEGKSSTIVDATENNIKILRLGSISKEEILDAI
jgi:L-threonylcarbamoyladenylate synthase